MQLQKMLVIGLAVMTLAGSGLGIAVAQPDEEPVKPGWTTAIMPGGDGGTERLERRAMTRVLSERPITLKFKPEFSRARPLNELRCRSHVYSLTSGSLEFRSRCLIDRSYGDPSF
jgi:hypothetical protein